VHENRLTRQQYAMFCLADMMTWVEVGAALARKAQTLSDASDNQVETIKTMSRIFASETSQLVAQNSLKIAMGTGVVDENSLAEFLASISYQHLVMSYPNLFRDMDRIADILFER
jgi:alkylation response protein AidB-like acyl-CoA dehydrogenase